MLEITVLDVLEAAWSFRVKAKECVSLCVCREDVFLFECATEKSILVLSLSSSLFLFCVALSRAVSLSVLSPVLLQPLYASSSKPMPTLCPPPFTFFPSTRAERVSFTPGLRVCV